MTAVRGSALVQLHWHEARGALTWIRTGTAADVEVFQGAAGRSVAVGVTTFASSSRSDLRFASTRGLRSPPDAWYDLGCYTA